MLQNQLFFTAKNICKPMTLEARPIKCTNGRTGKYGGGGGGGAHAAVILCVIYNYSSLLQHFCKYILIKQ